MKYEFLNLGPKELEGGDWIKGNGKLKTELTYAEEG